MLKDSQVDLCGRTDFTRTAPLLARDEAFSFACAGCGGCCRGREDIVLSGFDLWRIAARLRLPPRTVARAFCRGSIGRVTISAESVAAVVGKAFSPRKAMPPKSLNERLNKITL